MAESDTTYAKVIAKAWRDPAFKAEGINVPAGMAVSVVENTDKSFHLLLP
jgi:hypothetical protein